LWNGEILVEKKHIWYFVSGILVGIIIIPIIFQWLGIPTFDRLLYMIFGEANVGNGIFVIVMTIIAIILLVRVPKPKVK